MSLIIVKRVKVKRNVYGIKQYKTNNTGDHNHFLD